jgi:hypothetical protein
MRKRTKTTKRGKKNKGNEEVGISFNLKKKIQSTKPTTRCIGGQIGALVGVGSF